MRFALALAAGLFLTGCDFDDFGPSDRYQADFHYEYNLQPGGRLNVDNFNGGIEITAWDQEKVDITGVKYASTPEMRDALKIEIHDSPSVIDIRTVRPSSRHGNMGARYTIRVPRKTVLDRITSSNGSIRVRDVSGAAHLKSSNGSVRVDHLAGDVDAETSNGSIELESIAGGAIMRTSNGRIHAENISGECQAQTSNGGITIRLDNAPSSTMKLTSSNGAIDLTMTRPPKSDIRAETSNSSITLHLPSSTAARLSAGTSNSAITSDFDVAAQLHGETKHHLEGTIGGGGPLISLSTSNGHIRILKGTAD